MRQGQQHQKRMRGRSNNNSNNRKGGNNLNRSYESNGPDVKIRGTAAHIADKYVQLARDATSSGDPVSAENYLQHAEHYYRIVAASQPQYPQHQGGPGFVRADDESRDDFDDETGEGGQANGHDYQQPQNGYQQQAPQQPYQGGEGAPREAREYQPREHRDNREHRAPPVQQGGDQANGLPAFITGGGGEQGQPDRGEGGYGRNRNRRRFNNRYGRNGSGEPGQDGQEGPAGAAPSAEPEIAPGE